MLYPEAREYLNSFIDYEKNLDFPAENRTLKRVRVLLESLGNPQEKFKSIHIAGTKGKGSTCAFIFSILRDSAYKVGLYTSPHLLDLRERFKLSYVNEMNETKERVISTDELGVLVTELKPYLDRVEELTLFEVLTVMAFKYFADQGCNYAVIETGLGGTWDATNVITPIICGLTSISYDHTHILGKTMEEIAAAKCGIIKEGGVVVSAPQPIVASRIIAETCKDRGASLYEVGQQFVVDLIGQDIKCSLFDFRGKYGVFESLQINLLGYHQLINAAVALGIIQLLKFHDTVISPLAVRQGLLRTMWPGRMQVVHQDPFVILDGAQNRASADALRSAINMLLIPKRSIMILGVARDKDVAGICEQLCHQKNRVIVTEYDSPRAMPVKELAEKVKHYHHNVQEALNITDALTMAFENLGKEDLVLVTGSLHLVGEAFTALRRVRIPRG